MAGPIGAGPGTGRRRVFVLVDMGIVRGVFNSWDAAEAFADENRLSLDHLMEYETRRDYPDHLHLLSARWDQSWEFQGQWSKQPPRWNGPPSAIRLEHYHAGGDRFTLFRIKEFPFEEGILSRINPMAPDAALVIDVPSQKSEPVSQWKPKLTPLKPLPAEPAPIDEPSPIPPEIEEFIEPAIEQESFEETASTEEPIPPELIEPPVLEIKPILPRPTEPPQDTKPVLPEEPAASDFPPESTDHADLKPKPRISFQKGRPLKLKSKGLPQPIPAFKPTTSAPIEMHGNVSTVELAYADQQARAAEAEAQAQTGKPRRIWSLRLILSLGMIILCWAIGLFWALRPEPTAASVIAELAALKSARTIVFEPDMVFFQLDVEPAHQERWIQSLRLKPLEKDTVITMPTYHALDTWSRPEGFVRPPYAIVEVDEWLDLRLRKIQYAFIHRWDDGSILILDLESDMMIGWGYAKRYPELLN